MQSLATRVPNEVFHKMFGHFNLRPSSHRIYNSSAMGDLRGEADSVVLVDARSDRSGVFFELADDEDEVVFPEVDAGGNPATSSVSSVTTKPFAVISLRRVTRL